VVNYVYWKDSEYRECKGTDPCLMKTATVFNITWRCGSTAGWEAD